MGSSNSYFFNFFLVLYDRIYTTPFNCNYYGYNSSPISGKISGKI